MSCSAHVYVSGRVQGVFFRASAREEAERLFVSGWIKNLPDGRVEGFFSGDPEKVRQMVDWCHEGPASAWVTGVETTWCDEPCEHRGFKIL